jgi:ubiquinone biosynthesis monooxygenase Coq6
MGPIALLPIGDNYSNIVWTMSPDQATQHKSMDQDKFINSVNHALNYGYGPHPESSSLSNLLDSIAGTVMSTREKFEVPPKVLGLVSERMAFPLGLKHANSYSSKNVVLVGDAAHTVHPLAGQGVNLGFGDASVLAKILAEGVSVGADISEVYF